MCIILCDTILKALSMYISQPGCFFLQNKSEIKLFMQKECKKSSRVHSPLKVLDRNCVISSFAAMLQTRTLRTG